MEPSTHCPYLGLKQNRAIRFASPTPEHRCYVSGEPIDIPVDQAGYCLAAGHVHCPLYTGSMLGTTVPPANENTSAWDSATEPSASGLQGWLATLSPRDRAIYTLMIGLLGLIAAIYLFAGFQSLFGRGNSSRPLATVTAAAVVALPSAASTLVPTAAPTALPPTPTALPTNRPTAVPTAEPTAASVLFPPTEIATAAPSSVATAAATVVPTAAPTALPTAAPTAPPVASVSNQVVTLYFGDASGALFVPVQRTVPVEDNQIANAAVRELIAGPRNGLTPLLLPTTKLLDLQIDNATAVVNFDQRPTGQGDVRGYNAVVLTLTQFPAVRQVQFQINGKNTGIGSSGPVARPVLNPLNPDSLALNTATTEFLPLYFPLNDGIHDVRLIRLVPKTQETARATIEALLDGPGEFGYAVQRVIPEGTSLRDIQIDAATRILTVDFSSEFADAANREAAVRNVVQSLTTLPNIRGVQILVEGQPLADLWGEAYRNGFGKPAINPE